MFQFQRIEILKQFILRFEAKQTQLIIADFKVLMFQNTDQTQQSKYLLS